MPSSMPSSGPTGQPTSQPTSGPTVLPLFDPPTSQPTSRPTTINDNPLFAGSRGGASSNFNSMSTQSAIIIFSCIGAVVLCCFILFSCYFQDKYHNKKEEEKLHSLVEHHYNEDEVALDDGEGASTLQCLCLCVIIPLISTFSQTMILNGYTSFSSVTNTFYPLIFIRWSWSY